MYNGLTILRSIKNDANITNKKMLLLLFLAQWFIQ